MTAAQISRLTSLEYDLLAADTDVMELHNLVCALDVPGAVAAAASLAAARLRIRTALRQLDPAITEAVHRHESVAEPAPF